MYEFTAQPGDVRIHTAVVRIIVKLKSYENQREMSMSETYFVTGPGGVVNSYDSHTKPCIAIDSFTISIAGSCTDAVK